MITGLIMFFVIAVAELFCLNGYENLDDWIIFNSKNPAVRRITRLSFVLGAAAFFAGAFFANTFSADGDKIPSFCLAFATTILVRIFSFLGVLLIAILLYWAWRALKSIFNWLFIE